MSQPDISSQFTTVVSDEFEAPSVTVADAGETKGLDVEVKPCETVNDIVDDNQAADDEVKQESKTKDERKAEGRRIERKLNSLYKDKAEAIERATRAEQELAKLRNEVNNQKAKYEEVDLDDLNLDERIEHIANRKMEAHVYGQQEEQLTNEIRQAKEFQWMEKEAAVAEVFPDYYDVVTGNAKAFDSLDGMIQETIINSENAPRIVYELAKNPNLLDQLKRSNNNPIAAATILINLSNQVNANTNTQPTPMGNDVQRVQSIPKVSATPTPTHQGTSTKNWYELPFADVLAMSNTRGRR